MNADFYYYETTTSMHFICEVYDIVVYLVDIVPIRDCVFKLGMGVCEEKKRRIQLIVWV